MAATDALRDDALPAAVHLSGAGARQVLETALGAVGGELHMVRTAHVQYRPGSELVARYDATVSWHDRPPERETLLAATARGGAPNGTVPVVADAGGRELTVGVWRWPFDPSLPALTDMVTPTSAADRLAGVLCGPLTLEVVAYRPTERCVVRVSGADGRVVYVKILRPDQVCDVVDHHHHLRAAGIPVPTIAAADEHAGWVAMDELPGDTLRVLLKERRPGWPEGREYSALLARLRAVELPGTPTVATRTSDALAHGAMLAAVEPAERWRIERISEALAPAVERAASRCGPTTHGDLYESQLIVAGGAITGLLDIDGLGAGDPVDDYATVIGHLRYRETILRDAARRDAIARYADRLRADFLDDLATLGVDPDELDVATAAVLMGLATGPFRIQQRGWRREVGRVLDRADRLLAGDERSLSHSSSKRHRSGGTSQVSPSTPLTQRSAS